MAKSNFNSHPRGAFTNLEELMIHILQGGELYYAHALGGGSFVSNIKPESPVRIEAPLNDNKSLFVKWGKNQSFSLHDCNIQPNTYNDHYMFKDKEDAEAYVAYCKLFHRG